MELPQILCNALISASSFVLMALGFSLIYRTAGFFHFAHGAVFTVGAYAAYAMRSCLPVPLLPALGIAVGVSMLLGCGMELGIYRPLRRRGSSTLVLLLASLGLYVVLQNSIAVVFGADMKTIRASVVSEGIPLFGARITPIQISIIAVSAGLVLATYLLVKRTFFGKAVRAVASDSALASTSGIDTNKTVLWVFALASALAGAAGVLVALDLDMTPTMGLNALMTGVVVAIIGGVRSVPGMALGALLLALAQHVGGWKIGSEWQDTAAFLILLAFLLARPEGFLGKMLRKAAPRQI